MSHTLELRLWQPLTGGRIHLSIASPDGVHLSTVCGYDLAGYVCVKKEKAWHEILSCNECRARLRMLWPGVQHFKEPEPVFGQLFEWREQERWKKKNEARNGGC